MLRRTHRRRAGFSLVEVLVAMFIVAAGLIALLTLFPLGAIQMGHAMRDDRSQQTCLQADGKIRELWRARVMENTTGTYDAFYNELSTGSGAFGVVGATERRVSYPVMIDPIGRYSYGGVKQLRVGGVANGVTRQPHPLFAGLIPSMRLATLTDDMEFAANGEPANGEGNPVSTSGGDILRAGRYNWAAVLQRPGDGNPAVADLKILVFDRRSPGVDPTAPNNELQQPVNNLTPGTTQIPFAVGNDTLGLRVGSWIMDGTITNDANGNGTPNELGDNIRNANFYQVTAVDDTNPASTLVELRTPIVRPRGEANPTAAYNATFYIFRELIDVYDRPQLAPNGYQKQTP